MSQENVDVVRKLTDAMNRLDVDAGLALLDPDIEWDTTVRGADGVVVHGREQVVAVSNAWLDAWEDPGFKIERTVANRDQVAAVVRQHARGKLSGIEGDLVWSAVYTIQDGRITQYREYASWKAALEAAGLSE